jgi:hypothetical protein
MGTTLTGTKPKDTYDSLIKVTDNGPISGTAKYLSDGLGNDSALAMSTSRVGVNTASPTAGLEVITDGSSLNALRVASSRAYNLSTETAIVLRYLKNTTDYVSGALFVAAKDNTTINNESGNLQFYTNNAGSVGERMRITSDGYVRLAAGGLQFNGDTAAANALDDYEEGTWTIGITFGGASAGVTFFANTGTYTKIGRQVTVNGYLSLTSKGSSTGTAVLTGLPFTIANSNSNYAAPTLWFSNITFTNQFQANGIINSNNISLEEITILGASSTLTNADFANNSELMISFTYFV